MEQTKEQLQPSGRIQALDRARGICVVLMLLFSGIGFFPAFGPLYYISSDVRSIRVAIIDSVYFADFAVPCFLLMVGMSYTISFHKRFQKVGKKAYQHFLSRYLLFLGMGSILVSGEYLINGRKDPLFLQTLLMFVVFACCLLFLLQKLLLPKAKKAGSVIVKVLSASLIVLGIIGIILAVIDCIYQFTSPEEPSVIYENSMMHWSILHCIGMAGIWALLYAPLSLKHKIITFFSVGFVYTLLQSLPGRLDYFSIFVLGGFAGSIGWSLAVLAGMIFLELYLLPSGKRWCSLGLLVAVILMFPTCMFLPSSSRAVTTNFLFCAITFYGVIFFVSTLFDGWKPKFEPFSVLGRNTLVSFIVGVLLKAVLAYTWNPSPDTSIWLALLYFLFAAVVEYFIVGYLDRTGKSLRI